MNQEMQAIKIKSRMGKMTKMTRENPNQTDKCMVMMN